MPQGGAHQDTSQRRCPAVCPECRPTSAHSSPTQDKGGAGKAGVGGHHREDYKTYIMVCSDGTCYQEVRQGEVLC